MRPRFLFLGALLRVPWPFAAAAGVLLVRERPRSRASSPLGRPGERLAVLRRWLAERLSVFGRRTTFTARRSCLSVDSDESLSLISNLLLVSGFLLVGAIAPPKPQMLCLGQKAADDGDGGGDGGGDDQDDGCNFHEGDGDDRCDGFNVIN